MNGVTKYATTSITVIKYVDRNGLSVTTPAKKTWAWKSTIIFVFDPVQTGTSEFNIRGYLVSIIF